MSTSEDAPGEWDLLVALGREDGATCAVALAASVVRAAKAERAFVVSLDGAGALRAAWGADVEGLPIADAGRRIDAEVLASARRAASPIYQPEVATPAGCGSRLVVAGARSAVVVEHRFVRAAFDALPGKVAERWAAFADIAVRLSEQRGAASSSSPDEREHAPSAFVPDAESASSTSLPRREMRRDYPEIVGRSPALRRALAELDAAVDTDLPVLLTGETGTGKEVFARALHEHGARGGGPFVAVNCAAIADALFEAELFGHARGAFTGADRARGGLLARAEGGTLLLDEIGELPLARQATLLRALESRRFRPVGGDDERAFDVRIVAATNRDLDLEVEAGKFRKDLLYRLRVLTVVVPPLRERRGDVGVLLAHFLSRAGSRATIAPAALEALEAYGYPGNVRELHNFAARLAATNLARIELSNVPRAVRQGSTDRGPPGPDAQRTEIEQALARTEGNISRAAGLLGITRHGLKKRMLRLGLRAKGKAG